MTERPEFVARAFAAAGESDPLGRLAAGLGPGPFALVLLFVSPEADLAAVAASCGQAFPARQVAGCTTAGEIAPTGYETGGMVAIGFPERHFAAEALLIRNLSQAPAAELADALVQARHRLARDSSHLPGEFAILLVDGLSVKEDELASALAAGAGAMPLIGGSAGDGTRFGQTFVLHDGQLLRDAAVLSVLRSDCAMRPFSLDHLEPTECRMVVTEADPAARIVRRINAEPAAHEYARLLGKDPALLDRFTFAAHPLAVRIGRRHHVRSIQRIMPSGELVFFAAIDEGMVLSITRPRDLAGHLEQSLDALAAPGPPAAILAFDCLLRRIEAEEKQMVARVNALLRRNRVCGFNTYGEQVGPLHLNQTISGFAFYPPGTPLDEATA